MSNEKEYDLAFQKGYDSVAFQRYENNPYKRGTDLWNTFLSGETSALHIINNPSK